MKKPILVTGIHRSGSTWCGKVISRSKQVGYIQEPFNVNHRPGVYPVPVKKWFLCIQDSDTQCYPSYKRMLEFHYSLREELNSIKSTRDFLRCIYHTFYFTKHRINKSRPLVKDPLAIFSAEWIHRQFDADVVIIIRHPAAFVGSLKKANWFFPFEDFLEQKVLMNRIDPKYHHLIEEHNLKKNTIVEEGILLWNIIYDQVLKYRDQYPQWKFVRHEDLSLDPINEFKKIFNFLDIEFTAEVIKYLKKTTSVHNPSEQHDGSKILRDSRSNINNWKQRLTIEEIELVRKKTNSLASQFYSNQYW